MLGKQTELNSVYTPQEVKRDIDPFAATELNPFSKTPPSVDADWPLKHTNSSNLQYINRREMCCWRTAKKI